MRTFGIRISVIVVLLLPLSLIAQLGCPCQETECGDIIASFKLGGDKTEVCDGSAFPGINNSTIVDVSYFIWDWGDGTRDSVTTTATVNHIYNIAADKVCAKKKSTFEICLLAVKECGAGQYSCHTSRSPVSVIHRPIAAFNFTNSVCVDNKVNFQNMSCNVDEDLPDGYLWTFHDGTTSNEKNPSKTYTTTGSYTISLTVKNECGSNTTTQTIQVVGIPDAKVKISASATDSIVCVGDTITFIDLSNQWGINNNKWSWPGNVNPNRDTNDWKIIYPLRKRDSLSTAIKDSLPFMDTIIVVVLKPGNYTFKLTSSNVCGMAEWLFPLKVVEAPKIELMTPPPFCETAEYMPMATIMGDYTSLLWEFPGGIPSSSTMLNPGKIIYSSPGIYDVTLSVIAPCDTIVRRTQVIVNTKAGVTIDPIVNPYCQGNGPDTLSSSAPGGKWKGSGIIDTDLGIFDPSGLTPGSYTIEYIVGPLGCQSSDTVNVVVVASEALNLDPQIVCEDSPPIQMIGSISGGTWSGDSISTNGVLDPTVSGIGIFNVAYSVTDVNLCTIEKSTTITVEAFPQLSSLDTSLLCTGSGTANLNNILNINATPSGGTYTYTIGGFGVTETIDLSLYSIDTLPITFTYTKNECVVTDSAYIIFIEKPTLSVSTDTSLCVNEDTYQLNASIGGGVWSGVGVDANGLVNLSTAGDGPQIYTYIFQEGTSCELSDEVVLDIEDPSSNLSSGGPEEDCQGQSNFTFSGFSPSGGTWTGDFISDPILGTIDLINMTLDSSYTYQYCIENPSFQDCQACVSKQFILRSNPIAAFTIDGLPCINEEIILTSTSTNFTSLNWNLGDGTTSDQDTFRHIYTQQGNYQLTLTATNQYGCEHEITQDIYVTTKPISSFFIVAKDLCTPYTLELNNQSSGDNISYEWLIHGMSYQDLNPQNIQLDGITKDSTFIITLLTTNECGTVPYIDSITLKPYPVVDFGANDLQGCSPLEIDFSNTTVGNPMTYFWEMGNGNTYIDSLPPKQTYTTTDTSITEYTIRLISTNDCGEDTLSKIVTVYPPNVSAFIEAPDFQICQYDSLQFEAFSTPGAINTWEVISPTGAVFGAEGNRPFLHFNEVGLHTIILYASNCGTDTDTSTIEVLPAPEVSFEIPNYSCLNELVSFVNTSNALGRLEWDFGDGTTSAVASPSHLYQSEGTYIVTLTGYSLINDCPYSVSKQLLIVGVPQAGFDSDLKNGCPPLTINFSNSSVNATKYNWTFNDGTSNSTMTTPTHTFEQAGTYRVELIAFDDFNCYSDTSILNIIVHPKPTSIFTIEDKKYCENHDSIYFINQSVGANQQKWDVTLAVSDKQDLTIFANQVGIFEAQLNVANQFDCSDTSIHYFEIVASPTARFVTSDTIGCEDLTVTFENNSLQADNYIWSFDDSNTSTQINPTHTFTSEGLYTVSLISITVNGCPNDTATFNIQVNPKPIADFVALKDSLCGTPMNVQFSNASVGNVGTDWYIDNQIVSTTKNFSNTFTEPGTFKVELQIENEFGCKDTSSTLVDIYLKPQALFDATFNVCEREEIILYNLSTNANEYIWDIENIITTTDFEPTFIFDTAGVYTLSLIATYNGFCADTLRIDNYFNVFISPTADFDYVSSFEDNILGEVQFENKSMNHTSSYWDLGDGNTSIEDAPYHEYDINRSIDVKLIVENNNDGLYSCFDSIIKPVNPEWLVKFFAPNALSPEFGEGDVKVFKPVGVGIKKYEITIYSPWGEAVWSSTLLDDNGAPVESWDGYYKDDLVPQGAYSWIAQLLYVNDIAEVRRGSVTVLR